jgi:NCS2 family nucleobase:cation symporter-2/xanthine permease XanP
MDDINNFAVPESFFNAKPDELKQLGLILFSKYAREVKHSEISGYSYISFLI